MAGSRRRPPSPIRSTVRGHGAPRGRRSRSPGLPPPPPSHYHGVQQRQWGTWVSEITDHNTGRRYWLGTFQSARQAAWAHDIKNVEFHGADCGPLNFPLGSGPVPELVSPPSRGRAARIAREDREARERLDAEAAGEAYMAELRRLNPERVAAEAKRYAEYKARRGGGSSSSAAWSSSTAAVSSSVAASSWSAGLSSWSTGPSSSMAAARGKEIIEVSDDMDDSFNFDDIDDSFDFNFTDDEM